MKNYMIIFLFLIVSCTDGKLFNDNARDCIDSFEVPYSKSISAESYFKGTLNNDSICIYHGDGEFIFALNSITHYETLPGEKLNPKHDTSHIIGISLALSFGQKEYEDLSLIFRLETPIYPINTDFNKMINEIGNKKSLIIGDTDDKISDGYKIWWYIPCENYNLSPMLFATGLTWGLDFYYDQTAKWIKVKHFEKQENILGAYVYDIVFDVNVNIFTRKGYYGELKGIIKTKFALGK